MGRLQRRKFVHLLVIEVENVVLPERLPMKKEPETYTANLHFVGEEIQAANTYTHTLTRQANMNILKSI